MHLHALPADNNGPPLIFICAPYGYGLHGTPYELIDAGQNEIMFASNQMTPWPRGF